ncbi:MAG: NYN domain-containing protein [Planctomycetota bacterium]
MPMLIDCYNVLHCAMPPMLAGLDVEGLCRALSKTRWAKTDEITIVADGRPNPLGTPTSPVGEVELIYSGGSSLGGRTADDVIIARIADDATPRRLTVVSSDREIRAAARHRRCTSWSTEDFLSRLCGQLRRDASHARKDKPRGKQSKQDRQSGADRRLYGGISSEQALLWMREMGMTDAGEPAFQPYNSAPGITPTIQPKQLGIDLHLEEALVQLADLDMDELMRRFGKPRD